MTFVIVSFCLALVLILSRESIPQQLKKFLALFALGMVVISFLIIFFSFVYAS
jgi:hypothetical protein